MDGGAYCTLTPVVLSRGALHAGGPYRCPNVRIRARATRTNTPPNGAFRGFGAPQIEFAAETHLNRIAERARHLARSRSAAGTSTASATRRPTGQVLRESVAGEEVLERAAEAAEFERLRVADRARRAGARAGSRHDPRVAAADRAASGRRAGSAWRWPGTVPGSPGRARSSSPRSPRSSSPPTAAIRILTASTEMGQGTKTIFPQLVADALGVADRRRSRSRRRTRRSCPTPARPSRRGPRWSSAGCVIKAARRLRDRGRGGDRRPVRRRRTATTPGAPARSASTSASSRTRASASTTTTYRGDAYPAFGWAACVARVDVDLDTGEVHVRDVVAADDIGRVIHPVLAEGQVEGGTLQAVGYATIEEIKLRDGRYLNDRLATYIIPTVARRAADLDDPRRGAVRRCAARRQGRRRAADGRRGAGRRRGDRGCDRGLDRATCRPARSGSSRRWPAVPAVAPAPARGVGAGRDDRLPVHRQRRPGRGRRAGDAPPARRPPRGPRADRHEGGLRRRASAAPARSCSTALPVDSCLVPVCQVEGADGPDGRGARPAARAAARRAPGRVPRAPAAPSAASARRAC